MTFSLPVRRALLLAAALGTAGCDVADFASDPMPRFEQTWNLPAPSTNVSVASLLPAGTVTILPDSSAFALSITSASTASNSLGTYCNPCLAQNGTNAIKPAFDLSFSNTRPLPTDVVSASITNGTVNVQLTNGLSFDPIRVKTGAGEQGHIAIILVTTGGQVLGRDTIKGDTETWASGTTLNRTFPLTTGNLGSSVAVELHLYSPVGDAPVFMDASRTLDANLAVPTLHVGSVGLNIPNRSLTSAPDTIDLSGMGELGDRVVSGALEMTITNPFAITGNLGMRFAYGPNPSEEITKTITITPGVLAPQKIQLDSAEMSLLMGNEVAINVTGDVSAAGTVTVTPRQAIDIDNRMILKIRTGGQSDDEIGKFRAGN